MATTDAPTLAEQIAAVKNAAKHEMFNFNPDWLQYEALHAAAKTLRACEWRPIETAPIDGTPVLVYAPAYPAQGEGEPLPAIICACSYHEGGGWCVDELRHTTHWMPLPAGPDGV